MREQLSGLKSSSVITQKLDLLAEVLRKAENSAMKNESFFSNLTEVSTSLENINY